jgi:acyl-CoA reductase-like NAD-dependent aldehyde dehydrogenase
MTFGDEEEAVELANHTEYGLSANIWSRDLGRMLRMTQLIEAGTIWGNTMQLHHRALPFGGFKSSGLGGAYADRAIEGSTRLKRVSIRFDEAAAAPGWDDP